MAKKTRYQLLGFRNREEYLFNFAKIYNIPIIFIESIANKLGRKNDFSELPKFILEFYNTHKSICNICYTCPVKDCLNKVYIYNECKDKICKSLSI